MIHIQPSAYLMTAALILLLPVDWLLAFVFASVIHELGHIVVIYALNGHMNSLTIGPCGARIYADRMGNKQEFLCAAAGPAASLLLISACHILPKLAFCGMVQGFYNLIPIYPMDGGRMLNCFLQWSCPRQADRALRLVEWLILTALLLLVLVVRRTFRILPTLVGMSVLSRLVLGKIPCKSGRFAVQ